MPQLFFGCYCFSLSPYLEVIPVVGPWLTLLRAPGYDIGTDMGSLLGAFLEICVITLMGALLGDIYGSVDCT